ncbi:8451_t:CDS:2, partial [Ambispora gerdemannii]
PSHDEFELPDNCSIDDHASELKVDDPLDEHAVKGYVIKLILSLNMSQIKRGKIREKKSQAMRENDRNERKSLSHTEAQAVQ